MADYYPLISRAVAGLEKNNGENRRALYERARAALLAQLRGVTPALDESDITRERLALEESIRKVEAESARQFVEASRQMSAARIRSVESRAAEAAEWSESPAARIRSSEPRPAEPRQWQEVEPSAPSPRRFAVRRRPRRRARRRRHKTHAGSGRRRHRRRRHRRRPMGRPPIRSSTSRPSRRRPRRPRATCCADSWASDGCRPTAPGISATSPPEATRPAVLRARKNPRATRCRRPISTVPSVPTTARRSTVPMAGCSSRRRRRSACSSRRRTSRGRTRTFRSRCSNRRSRSTTLIRLRLTSGAFRRLRSRTRSSSRRRRRKRCGRRGRTAI